MILIFSSIILLTIFAGIANGAIKTIQHFWEGSLFESRWEKYFFTPYSWTNKYKNNDPKQGRRFWGSTTIFKWLTCGYRLLVMIRIASLFIAICLALLIKTTDLGAAISMLVLPFVYYYAGDFTHHLTRDRH